MFTCTLQCFSGTQGNPVKFTAKKFAVKNEKTKKSENDESNIGNQSLLANRQLKMNRSEPLLLFPWLGIAIVTLVFTNSSKIFYDFVLRIRIDFNLKESYL